MRIIDTNPQRYVAKVIFTYILGYKVDVGHMEAVNLISSSKYSEKQIVSPTLNDHLLHADGTIKGIFSRNIVDAREFGLLATSSELYSEGP